MNSRAKQYVATAKTALKRGDEEKWTAAENVWRANKEESASQAEIARELGKSQQAVSNMVALWERYHVHGELPDYTEAYYELRGFRTDATPQRRARSALRDPAIAREVVGDPEVRASVGRALDEHYTEQAKKSAAHARDKEVERKGGEDEYADHQRRQHVAEVVSVARGAMSGWRFVAGQVKSLDLDSGAADELAALADETEGFLSMFRSVLAGEEISDSDLAELLKEEA